MQQRGFSLVELLIVVAIILIVAAIAIPNLLRARLAANEASAISSMRSIATAQISYRIMYPEVGYASDLTQLGPTGGGDPTKDAADLLPSTLTTAPFKHSGYTFSLTGDSASFTADAVPSSAATGRRNFCTDTPAAIFYSEPTDTCKPGESLPIT